MKLICLIVTVCLVATVAAHSHHDHDVITVQPDDPSAHHPQLEDSSYHWCGTPHPQAVHRAMPTVRRGMRDVESCPTCTWYQCELSTYFGEEPPVCSNPSIRDGYSSIPSPALALRVHIYILRNTDGTNPIVTNGNLDWFENHMNLAYQPIGIQFQFTRLYADDNALRAQTVFDYQFDSFKTSVHNKVSSPPSQQKALRIYIANLSGGLLGSATFAYEPNVLDVTGGFIMSHTGAVPYCSSIECITGPHEMGHCLGTYHVFQDGLSSSPNQCKFCSWVQTQDLSVIEQTGDFCGDTHWVPPVHNEADSDCYGGFDFCPVGDADNQCSAYSCSSFILNIPHSIIEAHGKNYMSYLGCDTKEFTPKQGARMRCFTDYYLQDALVDGGTVPPPSTPPSSWVCDEDWWTDGWCDCGCGAYDPTCDNSDAPIFNSCPNGDECNLDPTKGCVGTADIYKLKVPSAKITKTSAVVRWIMDSDRYVIGKFILQKRIKKNGTWQSWSVVNKSIGKNVRKFTLKNLWKGRTYQARIRSQNPHGKSPWKTSKAFTTKV